MTSDDALNWLRISASARDESGTTVPELDTVAGVTGLDWFFAAPYLGSVAWRAASPLTPPDDRKVLVSVLHAARTMTNAHWRTMKAVPAFDPDDRIVEVAGGVIAVLAEDMRWDIELGGHPWYCVQYTDKPGEFPLPEDWQLFEENSWDNGFTSERIEKFCQALDANGPVAWRPELADELSTLTGMTRNEALLILAGLPGVQSYEKSYVDDEACDRIGLTKATVAGARERLKKLGHWVNRELLHAGIPADPATLWTDGPDLAGIAAVWNAHLGQRAAVPTELLLDAEKSLPIKDVGEHVSGLLNPESCPWLTTDELVAYRLRAVSNVLPWLAYQLPAGSPIRAQLRIALAAARARTEDPDLLYYFGMHSVTPRSKLFKLFGLAPTTQDARIDVDGWAVLIESYPPNYKVHVRPSEFRHAHLEKFDAAYGMVDNRQENPIEPLLVLRSGELAEACSQRANADSDTYYQDPSVSVPDLVSTVAEKYTLDTEAAALYLQILALPDPTDANIARWNGWKAPQLKAARAALAQTDLVVSEKRTRAGRSLFLPGDWLALRAPHLPIETWKVPFFRFNDKGKPTAVLAPIGTVASLFEAAWQRVENGDSPA